MKRKSAIVQMGEGLLFALLYWEVGIICAREWVMAEAVPVNILPEFIASVLLKAYPVIFVVLCYTAGKTSGQKCTKIYMRTFVAGILIPGIAFATESFFFDKIAETPLVLPVMFFASVVRSIPASGWIAGETGMKIFGMVVPAIAALVTVFVYNEQEAKYK